MATGSKQKNQTRRFIFIHINKTGGTSIEKALGLTPPPGYPIDHRTAREKLAEVGLEAWKNCFSFAVVRNPWDKVASHYHYRMQRPKNSLRDANIDFNTWVKRAYGDRDPQFYNNPTMFMPCFDWLTDNNGKQIVKYVCRFERLNRDFRYVAAKLNIKAELPHLKASSRGHYSEYYDDEAKDIIKERFAIDIKKFKYAFEEA